MSNIIHNLENTNTCIVSQSKYAIYEIKSILTAHNPVELYRKHNLLKLQIKKNGTAFS